MKKLFGTDGIRAVAGEPPLDPRTVRRFGAALGRTLERDGGCVLLGRDTRESGPWLRDAVADGLRAIGFSAVDAGVIPTPGLAHAVRSGSFAAGVMISASHNPFHDNGLKVFGPDGIKLPDRLEARVEQDILGDEPDPPETGAVPAEDGSAIAAYEEWLGGCISSPLAGLHVVLDCAHGAAYRLAPDVFRRLGAAVSVLHAEPNGKNINLNCGSLHLEGLARQVGSADADLGIAFDGDADRALAVDRRGRVVDGDHILYLTGRRLKREGRLPRDGVVATIMSNLWLERRLRDEGVTLHRAPVGDKYVLERMTEEDLVLGGEQSGHVIFRELSSTGDGILTGLLLLDTLVHEAEPLEKILDGIVPCPQVICNVRISSKPDLREHPRIGPEVRRVEGELGDRGRIVLRYSGTEPVARVMVEGEDADRVRVHAESLAALIGRTLGDG